MHDTQSPQLSDTEIKENNSLESQVLSDKTDRIIQELHLGELPQLQALAHIKRHAMASSFSSPFTMLTADL